MKARAGTNARALEKQFFNPVIFIMNDFPKAISYRTKQCVLFFFTAFENRFRKLNAVGWE